MTITDEMVERATLIGLLQRWLHYADSGHWRDRGGLSLKAAPVADDTRAVLEAALSGAKDD